MPSAEPTWKMMATGLKGLILAWLLWPTGGSAQDEWHLSTSPSLTLGSTDGLDPALTFDGVSGAVIVSDTVIAVADGGSRELRLFSREGRLLRSFGQEGDGPEEFRSIEWMNRCGEGRLYVYDFARWRLTIWSIEGELLDSFRPDGTGAGRPPLSLSCGEQGGLAVIGWPDITGSPIAGGPYRLQVDVGVLDSQGHLGKVLATVPGSERYRYPNNDGPRRLGKNTIVRMGRDVVYVGTGDSFRVLILKLDGQRSSLGREVPRVPFSDRMRDAWEASIVRRTRSDRRPAARRALQALVMPDSLPAYADLLVDRLGNVWVQHFSIPGEMRPEPIEWEVFDPGGEYLARVRMPGDFRPTDIGRDYVLGVGTGHDDVERIRLYGLSR